MVDGALVLGFWAGTAGVWGGRVEECVAGAQRDGGGFVVAVITTGFENQTRGAGDLVTFRATTFMVSSGSFSGSR